MTLPHPFEINETAAAAEAAELASRLQTQNQIGSVAEYLAAASILRACKTRLAALETKRKTITAGARQVIEETGNLFSPAEKAYAAAEVRLKALLTDFVDRRLPEAMIEAQIALAAGDHSALALAMQPLPSLEGISFRTVVDFEVEDESEIPPSYYKRELNSKLILTQLRNGGVVPGIRLLQRTTVAVSGER